MGPRDVGYIPGKNRIPLLHHHHHHHSRPRRHQSKVGQLEWLLGSNTATVEQQSVDAVVAAAAVAGLALSTRTASCGRDVLTANWEASRR